MYGIRLKTAVAGLCLALPCTSAEAGRAVFTGARDVEPVNAGFRRDTIVLHDNGFQVVNGDNPYRDYADHATHPWSGTFPDFFPELDGDIHPEIVEAIGTNDFTLELTLDPESTRLHPHTNTSGQRLGVYLQFDEQVFGGNYILVGFDSLGGVMEPGNRPFAIVGSGYWTYHIDRRDVTGTAETITLARRGDVFQVYTASKGSSFIAAAGQRADETVHADINRFGPGATLTAMAFWTESADGTPFDSDAGRLRSLVIASDALPRDINPGSHVPRRAAIPGTGPIVELSGTVADAVTGMPVDTAPVELLRDGVTYLALTDRDGRYAADVHPGDYALAVTRKGYEPLLAKVAVDANTVRDLAIVDYGHDHRVGADRALKTIEAAFAIANDGDTIRLDPGVYAEPLALISNVTIQGAGHDRTRVVGKAYADFAIRPFLAEYHPPYGSEAVFKAGLTDVVLAGFTLDGGQEHESFRAETVSERLALLMAIDRVDLATVKAMLEANPALATVRYHTEENPGKGATFLTRNMNPWVDWTPELRADNVEITRLLIENGADIEGTGGYAWSAGGRPLHLAANHDNVGAARLLLAAGADPNALARDRPPLEWSVGQGVRVAATASVLMDGGAEYNPLHLVRFKLLDRLAEEVGDRINDLFPVHDAAPTTLLHMAVRNDYPDVVAWLLERGADPNLVDANGLTPKGVAVTTDRSDAVRKLLGLEPEPAAGERERRHAPR